MISGEHRLGPPISTEDKIGEWSFQHFQHGSVCRHPNVGTREIPVPIRDHWMKGLVRALGFPTSDLKHIDIAGRPMQVMDFEGGKIYWDFNVNFVFNVRAPDAGTINKILIALAPEVFERWAMPFEDGVVGIHAALLHTNEVLFWAYKDDLGAHHHDEDENGNFITVPNGEWSLLSLGTGKQNPKKEYSERNQFCAGQCMLGDGKVFVVGGERDQPDTDRTVRLYNPTKRSWEDSSDLPVGRYYPTVVSVAGEYAIMVGGAEATAGAPGRGPNQTAQYIKETGALDDVHYFDDDLKTIDPSTYPFVFVLPGVRLFVHLATKSRILNLPGLDFNSSPKLNAVKTFSRTYGKQGTAVLLPLRPTDSPPYRPRIIVIGGGGTLEANTCEILDLGLPNPKWELQKATMQNPRTMGDAVLLPDGKVLVVNGCKLGSLGSATEPVLAAELYDPEEIDPTTGNKGKWTTLGEANVNRLYHATALLLPDARVLTAGTDRQWNNRTIGEDYAHTQLEVFSPPYLFMGPRPTLRFVPESLSYNTVFEVGTDDAESIKSAVLIRNGSCTHSFNSDQRFVELEIMKRTAEKGWELWGPEGSFKPPKYFVSGALELKAPPDGFVAPQGYYMLFLVSNGGVPSIAEFIRLYSSPI